MEDIRTLEKMMYEVAPGITYQHEIFLDAEDGRQEVYITKIAKDAPAYIDSTMPSGKQFGMEEPSLMALHSVPQGGTLVAAINADFFNMTNGMPQGPFIMNDCIYKDMMPENTHFFGVTKTGEYIIGGKADFLQTRNRLRCAVGGRDLLVDGDLLPEPALEMVPGCHPRTAIAIDESGALLLIVVDGRNPGISEGLHLKRLAIFLKSKGCKKALNLDGGGSSTFVVRKPGTAAAAVINHPSDGCERICANGIAVSTLCVSDGLCTSAIINMNHRKVVAGAHLHFEAIGMDKAGKSCPLPSNCYFALVEGQGILQANGGYVAPLFPSLETICLLDETGMELGRISFDVCIPDMLKISDSIVLPYMSTITIGVIPICMDCPVLDSPECYCYTSDGPNVSIDSMGVMTALKDNTTGSIIISLRSDSKIKSNQKYVVAQAPIILDTFDFSLPSTIDCTAASIIPQLVEARNGTNILMISLTNSIGMLFQKYCISTIPTAIGIWVNCERCIGLKVYCRVNISGNWSMPAEFKPSIPSDDVWQYLEANILFDKMIHNFSTTKMELQLSFVGIGTLYLDSIRAIFGFKMDQQNKIYVKATRIVKKKEEPLVNITLFLGEDSLPSYQVPIDYKRLHLFLDGKEVTNMPGHYGINRGTASVLLQNMDAVNGRHTIRLGIRDLMGNQAWYEEIFDGNKLLEQ